MVQDFSHQQYHRFFHAWIWRGRNGVFFSQFLFVWKPANLFRNSSNTKHQEFQVTDGWMNGWMDEWMNGWMDEWMNGWTNHYIYHWYPMVIWVPQNIHRQTSCQKKTSRKTKKKKKLPNQLSHKPNRNSLWKHQPKTIDGFLINRNGPPRSFQFRRSPPLATAPEQPTPQVVWGQGTGIMWIHDMW